MNLDHPAVTRAVDLLTEAKQPLHGDKTNILDILVWRYSFRFVCDYHIFVGPNVVGLDHSGRAQTGPPSRSTEWRVEMVVPTTQSRALLLEQQSCLSREYDTSEEALSFDAPHPALETALQWLWHRVGSSVGCCCAGVFSFSAPACCAGVSQATRA